MDIVLTVKCPDLVQSVGILAGLISKPEKTEVQSPGVIEPSKKSEPAPAPAPAPAVADGPKTAEPKYSQHEISLAGARLIQAEPGKIQKVHGLLEKYGVKSTKDLPASALDSFAEELIALGAEIHA